MNRISKKVLCGGFAMILGVIFGTLSSLFVAAPIAFKLISKGKK